MHLDWQSVWFVQHPYCWLWFKLHSLYQSECIFTSLGTNCVSKNGNKVGSASCPRLVWFTSACWVQANKKCKYTHGQPVQAICDLQKQLWRCQTQVLLRCLHTQLEGKCWWAERMSNWFPAFAQWLTAVKINCCIIHPSRLDLKNFTWNFSSYTLFYTLWNGGLSMCWLRREYIQQIWGGNQKLQRFKEQLSQNVTVAVCSDLLCISQVNYSPLFIFQR